MLRGLNAMGVSFYPDEASDAEEDGDESAESSLSLEPMWRELCPPIAALPRRFPDDDEHDPLTDESVEAALLKELDEEELLDQRDLKLSKQYEANLWKQAT